MGPESWQETADFIYNTLRLRTFPVAVNLTADPAGFPAKTRQPSAVLKKRVTICQATTMARLYGWTVGLTAKDLICVPAMIAFGFHDLPEPPRTMAKLFCEVTFSQDEATARQETADIRFLANDPNRALVLAPLRKGLFAPQVVVIYGNPAQIMRLIQSWVYVKGEKIRSQFGGKVECSEYLIAPFQQKAPRVIVPGMGDRIFSMTQDDEMVFALPGECLADLVRGMKEAGKKIGARYPVTFYQNFQPEFPPPYQALAEEIGIQFD